MNTHLKPGDKAPQFTALSQDGKSVSLDSFRGRKLILYFYPKDHSPGCTTEAQNMRDGQETLNKMGFEIVGVSPDSVKSHLNFHTKQELNFTLLSDPEKEISNAYGVWGEKIFMGRKVIGIHRTTFVIDRNGIIEKIFDKVQTKNHWQQIVDSYSAKLTK